MIPSVEGNDQTHTRQEWENAFRRKAFCYLALVTHVHRTSERVKSLSTFASLAVICNGFALQETNDCSSRLEPVTLSAKSSPPHQLLCDFLVHLRIIRIGLTPKARFKKVREGWCGAESIVGVCREHFVIYIRVQFELTVFADAFL